MLLPEEIGRKVGVVLLTVIYVLTLDYYSHFPETALLQYTIAPNLVLLSRTYLTTGGRIVNLSLSNLQLSFGSVTAVVPLNHNPTSWQEMMLKL